MTDTTPQAATTRHPRHGKRGITAFAMFGIALSLAACSSSSTPSDGSTGGSASSSHAITIKDFAFSPASVTVAPGAAVTVTNDDPVTHTVTRVTGGFRTGDIAANESKTFTAPKSPGTYAYRCSIHQFMSGTLVVSG